MKIGIQEISFRRYGGNYFKKISEYGFTAAIKDIGYSGAFSLECYAATTLPTEDLYVRLSQIYFEVAKHLVEKIEN